MELIEQIESLTRSKIDGDALIDIRYDEGGYVSGYIASKVFGRSQNGASAHKIERVLSDHLSPDQVGKILGVFPETLEQHANRLGWFKGGYSNVGSKYLYHKSGDCSYYYVFLDAVKIDSAFKSFFLVLNEAHKFAKHLTFEFPREVVEDFTGRGVNAYQSILVIMRNRAVDHIRKHLIGLHLRESASTGSQGDDLYGYAYGDLEIGCFNPSVSFFSQEEAEAIGKNLGDLMDCNVKKELARTIDLMNMISIHDLTT